jgi:hypothetical protein
MYNLCLRTLLNKLFGVFFVFICTAATLQAQVVVSGGTGAVTGSPYLTLSAAISAINSGGAFTAPVVVDVPAGYTESLTARITLTATGTVTNTLTIQKSGTGANPLLTAFTGTVSTPSTIADGFFVLAGSDYVTIDGIDLIEKATNVSTTTVMEFGYGLFKTSATDGCQNNTIKNCTITLNRLQNGAWTGGGYNGSIGIIAANATHTAATAVIVTTASGTNSNNKFYSNTIQNCNAGIAVVGFAAVTPFTLGDTNNEIGGSTPALGNTVLNFGGGAALNPAAGIFANQQWGLTISNNSVNSNNGSGVNHATTLRGIFCNPGSTSASVLVTANTVTVKSGATTSQLTGIDVQFGGTSASNTINVTNNIVQNCTHTSATTGAFQGILVSTTATQVNVTGNSILNNSQSGSGQFDCIVAQSTPVNVNLSTNTITGNAKLATGTMNGLSTTGNATNVTYNGNTISSNTIAGGSATCTMDCMRSALSNLVISNNSISTCGIIAMAGTSTGTVNGFSDVLSPSSESITNNNITALTIGGTSTSAAHVIRGIITTSAAAATKSISNNTIGQLGYTGSVGAATVSGIQTSNGNTVTISTNKIHDLQSNGTSGIVNGVNLLSGTNVTLTNNIIGNLLAPSASGLAAIQGIAVAGTSTVNLNFNTIYLQASSTSATFGTACISFVSTATSVTCRNNLLVNKSTPGSESANVATNGVAACIRRSAGTLNVIPANYSSSSNNNAFWCNATLGTNNHCVYIEGTGTPVNGKNTLEAWKNFHTTADQSSLEENPTFLSLVGNQAGFLHIDPSVPTQLESTANNISGISLDFDGHIRFGNLGYPGGSAGFPTGGSAPDIGADEFAGIFLDITDPIITHTPLNGTCLFTDRSVSATISDLSGVPLSGLLMPRLYYAKNGGSWFSVAGTLVTGTANNGNWNFTILNSLVGGVAIGDVISYYIVAQDVASTPNIGSNPAPGFSATDVNTITSEPTTPHTYTITAIPTFSAVNIIHPLCNGNTNGQISLSSASVNPVYNITPTSVQFPYSVFAGLSAQSYTLTVTDASSCSSTTVATLTNPTVLEATATITQPITCNIPEGTLTASQTGGTPGYTYQWIDGFTSNSVSMGALKDNTIYQGQVNNSNALGSQFLTGKSGASLHRALIAFDIAANIPANATITNVNLQLRCSGTPSIPTPQNFMLYRSLENWGEGTSIAAAVSGIGNLVPATPNDATWNAAFFPSTLWSTPGGVFSSTASATSLVNTIGFYDWNSSGMVSDVQFWLNNSSSNYGWMIRGIETAIHQARRFNSKNEAVIANRPLLTVEYEVPNVISTSSTLTNVAPGTYTLVVTDANGCSASSVVTVAASPNPIVVDINHTAIDCNGGLSSASSIVTGGVPGYTYSWTSDDIQSVYFIPSKDNTLYENNTNNSNGSGNQILAGNNGANLRNRTLLAFDLSSIPTGVTITSVAMDMYCTGGAGSSGIQNFTLHSMLEDWGEGSSNAGPAPGNGVPATSGDATWLNAFHPSTPWTTVGGTFQSTPSAQLPVDAVGSYQWVDAGMTADVQAWVSNPTSNFGWMIRGAETAAFQAKRFASREETDTIKRPYLYINYSATTLWSNQPNPSLPAGTYTLTVTDANGCTGSSVVTISQPSPVEVDAGVTPSSVICLGDTITLFGIGAVSYVWSGGVADGVPFVPTGTATYTVTGMDANGCTGLATIDIEVTACNATLDVKFFIEGYYQGGGLMTTVLLNTGEESNPLSTNVDTVSVELHDAVFPYSTVHNFTGIVQTDGHILCNFPSSVIGQSYYIVVRHKNSVVTWSANPLVFGATTSYDFTTAATQAFGSNMKDVFSENIWSVYSGDIANDDLIDAFDYIILDTDITAGLTGYHISDLNGDAAVDAFDYLVLDPNLTAGITSITP